MPRLCTPTGRAVKAAMLMSAAILVACGGGSEAPATPREVYDVPPALEVPTDDDPQEVPRPAGVAGRLPAGFPEDLPLVVPSSLIDYGREAGRPWVDLLVMSPPASVEAEMLRLARGAGWTGGAAGLRRGDREVRLDVRDGQPGAVVRISY